MLDNSENEKEKLVLRILYNTGMREAELKDLKKKDIAQTFDEDEH